MSEEIIKNIKEKIKNSEIKMKPKYYFVLGTISLFIGMLGSFFVSMFFIMALFYRVRMNGLGCTFMDKIPWVLILLTLGFFTLGIYLLKKYDIAYKTSILLIGILVAGVILTTSYIADKKDMHRPLRMNPKTERIFEQKFDERKLPPQMYNNCRPMKPEVKNLNHRRWN